LPAGVGKTTCLVQLASAYAHEHSETNVLVVDFSIHGDTTSQLLGAFGCQAAGHALAGVNLQAHHSCMPLTAKLLRALGVSGSRC
jgi:Mrp family chromosome partitioning ATPase